MSATIVWFRQDLRLQDNPALAAALAARDAVVPVYILDDAGEGNFPPGAASRWWLHHSLAQLDAALRERGSRLLLRQGETAVVLAALRRQLGATRVFWNRRYEPAAIARDRKLKAALVAEGVEVRSFNASVLFEPHTVEKKSGGPFQVFTPFWRHCLGLPVGMPAKLPAGDFPAPKKWPASGKLEALKLKPAIPWDAGLETTWRPGETGARQRLKRFLAGPVADYAECRNAPGETGTSMLSPHLHFGEIGPREVWAACQALSRDSGVFPANRGVQVFLTELGWREFAHHLLYHFPATAVAPLREEFNRFPWQQNPAHLDAWQKGATGYPIVDAGMRQLWTTGWMHNRVRMIVASFLVKHLRISWTEGQAWFHDTLVDADVANNTLGWQWSAGCGADAAPYFRVFNPTLQGEKFDAAGTYVRRWVPEIAGLPDQYIHRPWTAPTEALVKARVILGREYPAPIVDHAKARGDALAAFQAMRAAPGDLPGISRRETLTSE